MSENITTIETAIAEPYPSAMIETFRAIGYNIETAVADIIDNSISAGAKNIHINFAWKGADSYIAIKDDGCGMNSDELINAMRPGSISPLVERQEKDLGRFGLGLKTASFSQCKRLTVISKKKEYQPTHWTWDLDHVKETGKWELIKPQIDSMFRAQLNEIESGSIVLWNNIDRCVKGCREDDSLAYDKFLKTMIKVKSHLAMVFHKYIEKNKISIYYQNELIIPWNPFELPNSSKINSSSGPIETFSNGQVKIQGFILPHKSRISEEQYKTLGGTKGWNEHQGFYIYRNDRMLVAGHWLNLFNKEDHYKLCRIEIDIPNTLDSEWQIDIKKAIARPPIYLRDSLRAYALKVRSAAQEVFRHRGKTVRMVNNLEFVPIWLDSRKGDKWFFKINREHPIISNATELAKANPKQAINMLLRFIEETIPAKSIYIKEAEQSEQQCLPFENRNNADIEIIKDTINLLYKNFKDTGCDSTVAKSIIMNMEPFNSFPVIIESLGD